MKKYTFPYGGTIGKCESWDSEIDVELTDEEAARLEASARSGEFMDMYDDDSISDIYEKVKGIAFAENKRILEACGRLDELREDYDEEDAPSDDELVDEEMGMWHVGYPVELQRLDGDNP